MSASSLRLLTAEEALRLLSIRRQTLYAYVSKGWIRSVAVPNSREHRYLYDDCQRVHQRALARAGHRAAASAALSGDTPLISSAITELRPSGPWYRGYSALELAAAGISFEAVCHLLWQGELAEPVACPPATLTLQTAYHPGPNGDSRHWHRQFASCLLTSDTLEKPTGYADCLALQQHAIGYLGHLGPARRFIPAQPRQPCVAHLAAALGLADTPLVRQSLGLFLILFCEHELSPSTFAVRTAASTGTAVTAALASALAVTTGHALHGIYIELQDWLARHPGLPALQAAAHASLEAGRGLPGYNHPVYHDQDVRTTALLEHLRTHYAHLPALQPLLAYIDWLAAEHGLHPRHELACLALGRALGLPLEQVPAVFVVARQAGWIAHYLEQCEQGQLFRPRAYLTPG
ncbi:Citrate synthase 2 [Pigmentiphaga humi]|uniref:citrate synthase (unknown stereospecificity) n=1 Tax=Pigmentiphaga humi TaxID=2478468 RepID=A0A3P4B0L2_9BURK|nr:citrate/2-methylcitrate synthase [Pigmentiphaga humi]VCU69837.1 Citrate synthase 2 [Pigmentiphaga humi]